MELGLFSARRLLLLSLVVRLEAAPGLSRRENERVEIREHLAEWKPTPARATFSLNRGVEDAPRLPAGLCRDPAAGAHNAGSPPRDWSRRVAMTAASVERAGAGRPQARTASPRADPPLLSAPPRPWQWEGAGPAS